MDEQTREFEFEDMASRSARCASLGALHLVYGEAAGRLLMLDADVLTLGRTPANDLQFQVEGVSRQHARIERTGQNVFTIYDLNSTNGLFVNGFATDKQTLKDGDRVALGPNLVFSFRTFQSDEADAMETLSASRSRDLLTGALNAAYFEEMLRFELELGQRRNFDVGLACFELTQVHPTQTDAWARRFCQFLEARQKPGSLIGRLGPHRFAQSLAYVARQEMETTFEQWHDGLREQFPEVKILSGAACSRDLASPTAASLIEKASRLNRVT